MNKIQKIFFSSTMSFFILVIYSLSIAQNLPIEIGDWKLQQKFYDFIILGIPLFILLTLVWTIRKSSTLKRRMTILLSTLTGFLISIFLVVFLLFAYGFGAWIDKEVLFKNKENANITIKKQVLDNGAFGCDRHRIVKLEPYYMFWNKVTIVDTNMIDYSKWEHEYIDENE